VIRNAFGGTVNDIVVAVLAEGAARYLKHHGYSTDGFLRLGCPASVRRTEEQTDLGNRVSMMFPTVPAAPMDMVERLRVVGEENYQIKADGLPQELERLTALADLVPPALMVGVARLGIMAMGTVGAIARASGWRPRPDGFLMRPPGFHFVATNVPGVQVPLYLAGHRCAAHIGLVPIGGNLGLGVAIVSYNGDLCYGMVADPDLVPDLALMKAYVEQVFAELKSEAEKRGVRESLKAAA
jgi:diacylglycerol O-acyltransferase / wax synthase